MAARSRKTKLDERWRARIRTSMLINRVQDHAFGKLAKPMDQLQLKACEILLRKVAPDLSATDLSANVNVHESAVDLLGSGTRRS